MKTLKQRFMDGFEPVTESGCWIWTKALTRGGYGQISNEGKMKRAHRASYEIFRGLIPAGMCVLHKCDVPSCVNPAHLLLGTQVENISDMDKKRRRAVGSRKRSAKLSEQDVIEIRMSALGCVELGREFGIHNSAISRIKTGKAWKHIP